MSSRWQPRITRPGTGGGPPPPSSEDRFEANILVGNELNGDSSTAQAAPFQYIADPGDGSGVRAALAVAAADPTTRYRIRVRPGVYTFPDAGVFPIEIPTNCTLEGSGIERTVFRQEADNWNLFQLLAGNVTERAELHSCTVNVSDLASTAIPTGPYVVDVQDYARCLNVRIYAQTEQGVVSWSGREYFRCSGVEPAVLDCEVVSNVAGGSYTTIVNAPPAVRLGRASTTTTRAQVRVRLSGSTPTSAVSMAAFTTVTACLVDVSGSGALGVLRGSAHVIRFDLIAIPPASDFGDERVLNALALSYSEVSGVFGSGGGLPVRTWDINAASEFNVFRITSTVDPGTEPSCAGDNNEFLGCVGAVGGVFSGTKNTLTGGQYTEYSVEFDGDDNTITGAYLVFDLALRGVANACVNCRVAQDISVAGTNNLAVANRAATVTITGTTPEVANNITGV